MQKTHPVFFICKRALANERKGRESMTDGSKMRRRRIEKLILVRLEKLLTDEDSTNADVFKAAALFCDHFREEWDVKDGGHVEVTFTE